MEDASGPEIKREGDSRETANNGIGGWQQKKRVHTGNRCVDPRLSWRVFEYIWARGHKLLAKRN